MGNGGGIPLSLVSTDYSKIKSGTLITSGTYEGCIQVGSNYYWIHRGEESWVLEGGAPGESQVEIGEAVWERCCEGGSYVYNGTLGGWYDGGQQGYKWNGPAGGAVYLDEV